MQQSRAIQDNDDFKQSNQLEPGLLEDLLLVKVPGEKQCGPTDGMALKSNLEKDECHQLPEVLPVFHIDEPMHKAQTAKIEAQSEVKRKRLERMQVEFEKLDKTSNGKITVQDLAMMVQSQQRKGKRQLKKRDLAELIQDLDEAVGHFRDNDRDGPQGITFPVFVDLMTATDLETKVSAALWQEIHELKDIIFEEETAILVADAVHVKKSQIDESFHHSKFENALNAIVSFLIVVNTVTVGLSCDYPEHSNVFWNLEYVFTCVFTFEMLFKIFTLGPTRHFLEKHWHWNQCDALIVLLAWIDIILKWTLEDTDLSNVTVLRVIRLGRLSRTIRLVPLLKELYLMIEGLVQAVRTLLSAMVLLAVIIYIVSILLTIVVGTKGGKGDALPYRDQLFSTVPRSMWTVFRCVSGMGCDNYDESALTHQLTEIYGPGFTIIFCFIFVVINFGLFNLVMALIVEYSVQNAKFLDRKVAAARHKERMHIASKLRELVRQFCTIENVTTNLAQSQKPGLRQHIKDFRDFLFPQAIDNVEAALGDVRDVAIEVTREQYEKLMQNPEVNRLMDDLQLPEGDRLELFDAFDADADGTLTNAELTKGILKARGHDSTRADCAAAHSSIRNITKSLKNFECSAMDQEDHIQLRLKRLEMKVDKLTQPFQEIEELLNRRLALARQNSAFAGLSADTGDAVSIMTESREPVVEDVPSHDVAHAVATGFFNVADFLTNAALSVTAVADEPAHEGYPSNHDTCNGRPDDTAMDVSCVPVQSNDRDSMTMPSCLPGPQQDVLDGSKFHLTPKAEGAVTIAATSEKIVEVVPKLHEKVPQQNRSDQKPFDTAAHGQDNSMSCFRQSHGKARRVSCMGLVDEVCPDSEVRGRSADNFAGPVAGPDLVRPVPALSSHNGFLSSRQQHSPQDVPH
eukprot:gnl/MRDRNA2_/MRDRNA2_33263_c0_seq1.p1 gnl/MRDRNA2_/MRDRNA2_33263_c0~~gnl/MRDRNA2_/MRDRNA2_33263_c0_seq1.p1  ORF type:complete len:913 (-),score=170.67 gnl/MRDRNA2_/MRDRNA2_33263_c0_seq1:20-2758(-)